MKEKYIITIQETVSKDFEVEAESTEDAAKIAEEKYDTGEFVLSPGNLISKKMLVQCKNEEVISDWVEF